MTRVMMAAATTHLGLKIVFPLSQNPIVPPSQFQHPSLLEMQKALISRQGVSKYLYVHRADNLGAMGMPLATKELICCNNVK
jgi:hypothetical protein